VLRINEETQELVAMEEGTLVDEGILERGDLQEMMVRSWAAFGSELGFSALKLLGTEVVPDDSCRDRIDVLAFDEDDGRPVVIELKRDSHKLQLLQALSYAAMVSRWGEDDYRRVLGDTDDEDLVASIGALEEELSPRVILIAEAFDPEVIITAHWLTASHGVDIHCFSLRVLKLGVHRHMSLRLDYPLRALDDLYKRRGRARNDQPSDRTWDEVKQWIVYDWGADLIDLHLENGKTGDPRRRRLNSLGPIQGGSYYLTLNKHRVAVSIGLRSDEDLDDRLSWWSGQLGGAAMGTWGGDQADSQGLRIYLDSRDQAQAFLSVVGDFVLSGGPDDVSHDVAAPGA
jgi:hypothetical protein